MTLFVLDIELGNDAMQTAEDVADALRRTAEYIEGTGGWEHIDTGTVRDANGNRVGVWTYGHELTPAERADFNDD